MSTSAILLMTVALAAPPATATDSRPIDFSSQIRPLLSDRCFACHGPDATTRQAGLRLDTRDGALARLENGRAAIVPGKPDASLLVERIHASDPDEVMPPPRLNRPLSAAERQLLVDWIRQGAPYARHWAFTPPAASPPPRIVRADWPRDPLDNFILAKQESAGLTPNPRADRSALLRRASLALTGLPPTPDQLREFLADDSPDAWERRVDALLASPRYGERMAQEWLDLARFADTLGYQIDGNCFVWPWRDWVLRAFNSNLSYDQFLTWQIAGDLLPNATQDQRLATLFNRLHRQTNEGGSIEKEFRQEYISDRVHTAGTAFLGLTLECSKCHNHKYDPIPQTDYYSLCAMFGQIDECGLYPYGVPTSAAEPSFRLLEPQHKPELARRQAALDAARSAAERAYASREEAFRAWLAATAELPVPAPSDHFSCDELVEGKVPNLAPQGAPGVISGGKLSPTPGAVRGALEFDGDTVLTLEGVKGITRHDPLTVSLRLYSPDRKERALLFHTGPALYALASDASGFELLLEEGKLRWSCIFLWPGCAASIETRDDFPVGKWVEVTVTYDGSSRASGLKVYLDGRPVATDILYDQLDKNIIAEPMRLGARPRDDRGFAQGRMDEIQVFRQALSPLEVARRNPADLAEALAKAKQGDPAALDALREHYLLRVDAETARARQQVNAALRQLEDEFLHKLPLIMTMKQSPRPRPFYVLTRGDYAAPDKSRPVEPSAPGEIFPFPADAPRNRLGLARWMTDSNQPLTPRVAVNRLWTQCFGQGIVISQENFGQQGDAPSHPELLDTLAHDFARSGWDLKAALRRIALSSTYQQSSASTPEKRERDAANRLLARGPAFRLSGEAIRDQALAAAGLLVEKIGGPSVKPWQPPGVWSESGASGGEYAPDTGEGRYRRSIYTFRKRTAPPPGMITLDAGSREVCQPRRITTNTPLQALIFLNDQSFFECAREIARRVQRERTERAEDQLILAFELLASRSPAAPELAALRELYARQLEKYSQDAAATQAVAASDQAPLAALTIVCSTLLTADAVITSR